MISGKGPIQKVNKQTVYAYHSLITNFTETDKIFVLSVHYDGSNSKIFVIGVRQVVFKANDSKIRPYKMCLGNISANFSATNALKQVYMGIFTIFQ